MRIIRFLLGKLILLCNWLNPVPGIANENS